MNAYTRQDLSVMQVWPLERKIRVTQAKIIEWYHHYGGKVAVSFSGGKDSTVLLDLARRAFPDIPAVFVDTGLEYPEIREFVKTVPNVTWLRPEMPFSKVISEYGYPVVSKDVARRVRYAKRGSPPECLSQNRLQRLSQAGPHLSAHVLLDRAGRIDLSQNDRHPVCLRLR